MWRTARKQLGSLLRTGGKALVKARHAAAAQDWTRREVLDVVRAVAVRGVPEASEGGWQKIKQELPSLKKSADDIQVLFSHLWAYCHEATGRPVPSKPQVLTSFHRFCQRRVLTMWCRSNHRFRLRSAM